MIPTPSSPSRARRKVHRGRVMEKMKVESVADLVRVSQKLGIGLGPPTQPQ